MRSLSSTLKKAGERQQFYLWAIKQVLARPGPVSLLSHASLSTESRRHRRRGAELRRVTCQAEVRSLSTPTDEVVVIPVFTSTPFSPSRASVHDMVADGNYCSLTANNSWWNVFCLEGANGPVLVGESAGLLAPLERYGQ